MFMIKIEPPESCGSSGDQRLQVFASLLLPAACVICVAHLSTKCSLRRWHCYVPIVCFVPAVNWKIWLIPTILFPLQTNIKWEKKNLIKLFKFSLLENYSYPEIKAFSCFSALCLKLVFRTPTITLWYLFIIFYKVTKCIPAIWHEQESRHQRQARGTSCF